jgi:hypothetical protein
VTIANILESISIIVAAIAVVVGIYKWRTEYLGKRKIELVEEVLALFYEIRDIIKYIRSPFSYASEGSTRKASDNETPAQKIVYDRVYVLFERYDKHKDKFSKLQSLKYRYWAYFGEKSVEPFNELNSVMNELFASANILSYYWLDRENSFHIDTNKEKLEEINNNIRKNEAIFWDRYKEDTINPKVEAIITKIENQASKIINP